MKKDLVEKTVTSESIFSGRVIDLVVEEVVLPDGNKSKREIVRHPGAVCVIAITPEGKIVLIRQYRKPLDRVIVEIPAGKLEVGEDPKECAKRELEEETAYTTRDLEHVISFYTSPGFADELVHVYFTDQLEKGTAGLDEDEFLEVIEVTLEEAIKMVEKQEIYDAKTAYAIQFLQLRNKAGV